MKEKQVEWENFYIEETCKREKFKMKRQIKFFYVHIFPLYLKLFHRNSKFIFNGEKYDYFYHHYNMAWANERSVEIAVIKKILDTSKEKEILEVGNVLSHYFPPRGDIIDKFEKANGVINEDVVDFKPKKRYDLIVSISTLEHVGFDDITNDSHQILLAIKNLKDNCLKKGGKIVVTLPLGYNLYMDKMLFSGELKFDEKYYLKRLSWGNKWKQTSSEEVIGIKYDFPFIEANGLFIGTVFKK